jgi:outer membrane biosynthesis protein TonB
MAKETSTTKEAATEQPKVEEVKVTMVEAPKTEPKAEKPKEEVKAAAEPQKSEEERILDYLKRGRGDFMPLNDFLKSLYPTPKFGETIQWNKQPESKRLKGLLTKLAAEKKIEISNNMHLNLGKFYYEHSDANQVTKYHSIATVNILAKLV